LSLEQMFTGTTSRQTVQKQKRPMRKSYLRCQMVWPEDLCYLLL